MFALSLTELSGTNLVRHKINIGNAPPQRSRCYNHPPKVREEIQRQVNELFENDIIEPSNSVWQSPVILVKKKNGQFRMCVDLRKVNAVTEKISFPLMRMQDVFDTVAEKQPSIFTLLDL